jgi:hypothetical protein
MIYKGLNAIRTKAHQKEINLGVLEEKIIMIPKIFKLFLEHFELGKDSLIIDYLFDSKRDIQLPLNGYFFKKGNGFYGVEYFLGLSEILELLENDDSAIFNADGTASLMRIAETTDSGGGGFYLGLNGENADKIYKVSWDGNSEEDDKKLLAHNILEFISGFFSQRNTFNKVAFDNLYKNWGEDFWRVKE